MDNFNETVQSLFNGMTNFMTTKTVVGDAVNINDTIILPLVDVSFGMGAGSKSNADPGSAKDSCSGGMGGKMSPSAVLVIKDGSTKLVNIKNQDTITKILDMVPDLVEKLTNKNASDNKQMSDEEIIDAAKESVDNTEN